MTDDEITRQLATKVMGWTVADHPEKDGSGQWHEEYACPAYFHAGAFLISSLRWNPLEDIADAWEVRDRLAEGGRIEVVRYIHGKEGVEFTPRPDCGFAMFAEASADSATRAICLCALRAVGMEPEG